MKKVTAVIILCSMILLLFSPAVINAKSNNTSGLIEKKDIMTIATTDSQFDISSVSAVLIEGSTGTVIFDKNKDERLKPASITKIMTLLLIFEALDSGKISLTDEVSVSEHAASMGGSQVFLEPNEKQQVDTMLKCISIASANDACVAMAEYIAGSEEEFVARMNQRAKELGMKNTNFVNCCGLDVDNHYSTAYDVALMSKELITKHPEISKYSTVWMDTFIHTTRKGKTEFGLNNTNKLIRFYNGITGLKTGSTSLAKYCLSATARRNNMDLIAVVMAAPETKTRFAEAAKLLNYGFANYSVFVDENKDTAISPVRVVKGVTDAVTGKADGKFSYLCTKGKSSADIRKEVVLYEELKAPVKKNDKIGDIVYYLKDQKIGSLDIKAIDKVDKAGFMDCFYKILNRYFLSKQK